MNYIIENNINFYEQLNKELNITDNSNVSHNTDVIDSSNIITDNDDNICLLTHQPLEYNFITLHCKHKFNYIPLYNEISRQKIKNYLETTYVSLYQMKCPYCRTITNKLLPYIIHNDVIRKVGVNSPQKYCMALHTCSWTIKSGKNKNTICNKPAHESDNGIYCSLHQNICNKNLNKISELESINKNWSETHSNINKKYNIKQLKQLIVDMNNNNTSKYKILIGGTKKELVSRVLAYELIDSSNI